MELNIFQKFTPSPLLVEGHHHEQAVRALVEQVFQQQSKSFPRSETHLDWLQASGNELKMEELRDFLYRLRLHPSDLGVKILSITQFQDCSRNIQNALLKTLEEPLPYWKIFLGITNSFGVLPTIRSRCLIYRLPQDSNTVELDETEQKIYEAIIHLEDFGCYELLEQKFKSRDQFYQMLQQFLWKASLESYPGYWKVFAPALEEKTPLFDRNIHPKAIWEAAWSEAECLS